MLIGQLLVINSICFEMDKFDKYENIELNTMQIRSCTSSQEHILSFKCVTFNEIHCIHFS